MVYIVYMKGKLMKDSTAECSDPPSDSEMAVSMVTNGSLKRPAEDMMDTHEEPENNPMKLLSTAFMDHKKMKKDDGPYFNNNGMDSDGGSLKPSDPDSEPDHEQEEEEKDARSHEFPTPTPPFVWTNGSSPMRPVEERESSSPQPPALPTPAPRSFPCVWTGEDGESSPQPPMLQPIEITPTDSHNNPLKSTPPPPVTELPPPMPYKPLVQADIANSPAEQALSDGETSQGGASPLRGPNGTLTGNTTIIDADGQSVEVCPLCQKVFKRKVYLQRHMEREHWSTAKVFKCQDCNYETKHQSNLSVHRRTHTGERPYHCGCCGQRYTQGHLLKSHIRSRHGGNMELYNLEKKSDSSRGRKSLDIKRDLLASSAAFPAPQPYVKQEKISSILAAAAAVSSNPSPASHEKNSSMDSSRNKMSPYPAQFPTPPNMSRYMSSLGGYFGSMQPGTPAANAAAAIMNPMLGAGLLTAPRYFPGLGGLPMSSPSMVPSAAAPPLMPALPSSDNITSTTASYMENLPGMKLPVKMPDSVSPSKLSPNKPQSASLVPTSPPSPQQKHQQEEESMPQDLSMKRSSSTPSATETPEDLTRPVDEGRPVTEQNHQDDIRQSSTPSLPNSHSLDMSRQQETQSPSEQPTKSPERQSTPSQSVFPGYGQEAEEEQDENQAPTLPPRSQSASPACPVDKKCCHEDKLMKLRQNVLRMLSVLTPDIGIENDINFKTDQVDQLLYEVIYSNFD